MTSKKDQNFVNSMTAVLNTDGKTIINLTADPSTHALGVVVGTTGTDFGPQDALKDDVNTSTLLAVSRLDGLTPVVLYADASGNLLTDSISL